VERTSQCEGRCRHHKWSRDAGGASGATAAAFTSAACSPNSSTGRRDRRRRALHTSRTLGMRLRPPRRQRRHVLAGGVAPPAQPLHGTWPVRSLRLHGHPLRVSVLTVRYARNRTADTLIVCAVGGSAAVTDASPLGGSPPPHSPRRCGPLRTQLQKILPWTQLPRVTPSTGTTALLIAAGQVVAAVFVAQKGCGA